MAVISRTVIGTSDPVDICRGFALFASNARAIQLGYNVQKTLLAMNPQIAAWRLNVDAGYKFFAGVCGPAYALRFEASGTTTGDRIALDVTNDETAAGFVFGIQAELYFNVSIEQYNIKFIADGWNTRFESDWATALNFPISISVDIIELIRNLVLKYFATKQKQKDTKLEKNESKLPQRVKSYGMFDYKAKQFATNGGALDVTPGFALPVNLVPLTKTLPVPLNAPFLFDKALDKLWGGFEMGPRFTIAIPVKIQMTHITVAGATYRNLTYSGSTVRGSGGREIPNPDVISVGLQETPGFEITFDFFVNLSVCKLFSLEASVPIANLTALLGIKVALGPFNHTCTSTVGAGPRATAHGFADERDDLAAATPIEVIFEDVEEVA